jgi:glycosyltransferase involved in cell wall biosynthesis
MVCLDETAVRIRHTLESVERQVYPHIERVVVDGGSGADTLTALRDPGSRVDRLLCESDRGVMDAMNKGVALASGDLIAFMNIGDRFARPDAIDRLVEALVDSPGPAFSYGDFVRTGRDGRPVLVRTPRLSRFTLYRGGLCHQTVLARRMLFRLVGPFDEKMDSLGDMDWFARVIEAGYTGVHAGAVVCEYEMGGKSVRDLHGYFAAFARFRRRHFPPAERALYCPAALAMRAAQRLQSRDFTVPARMRCLLGARGGTGFPARVGG